MHLYGCSLAGFQEVHLKVAIAALSGVFRHKHINQRIQVMMLSVTVKRLIASIRADALWRLFLIWQ